jgi:hypothetical protein
MTAPMTALGRAIAAWTTGGQDVPDWVGALAIACDESSQNAIAKRLDYSPAVVSNVLRRTYSGDLRAVEQAVRGRLMNQKVTCPVVGELDAATCNGHQRAPWSPHNPQRIQFYRACRAGCPNSRLPKGENR